MGGRIEIYLAVAYAVIWVSASVYLVYLSRQERSLGSEVRELKTQLGHDDLAEEPR